MAAVTGCGPPFVTGCGPPCFLHENHGFDFSVKVVPRFIRVPAFHHFFFFRGRTCRAAFWTMFHLEQLVMPMIQVGCVSQILLIDNHCSHLSLEAIDLVQSGVHIVTFPLCLSLFLDMSVFGPVKSYYKSQCSAWQKNNANKILEICHIGGLACKAFDLALTPKVIKSGFRATGICPYNPDIFSDADFVQAVQPNEAEVAVEGPIDENDRIVVGPLVGREEVVPTTPEPSSRSISISCFLDEIAQKALYPKNHQIAAESQ